jgi:hypothetical protein
MDIDVLDGVSRKEACLEDIREASTLRELARIMDCVALTELGDDEDVKAAALEREQALVVEKERKEKEMADGEEVVQVKRSELEALLKQLRAVGTVKQAVGAEAKSKIPKPRDRKYRVLSTNVGWCTTPQVHALVRILAAPNREITEAEAWDLFDKNKSLLACRQPAVRVFLFYRKQLLEHGNIEMT